MSKSGAGSATLRWILLGLLIAVVVVVSYVAIEASDLTLGTVSSSFVAAAGSGCLVLIIGLYVLSRRARSTEGIDLRLDRIATPTTPPNSDNSLQESESGEAGDASRATDEPAIEKPAPAIGRPQDPETSQPDAESPVDVPASDPKSTPSTPSRQAPAGMPPISSPSPSTASRDRIDADQFIEAIGLDAVRLAAALNRYEQTGFSTDSNINSSASGAQRYEQDLGERGLWRDLVDAYGAESIDLSGIHAGRCRITLKSGNMVFYVPEYGQWVWLAIERTDAAERNVSDEPLVDQRAGNLALDTGTSSASTASQEQSGTHTGSGIREEVEDGLMRLARSNLGRPVSTPQPGSQRIMVVDMAQVLSSQNTPAAYEEALFVTEGLLLGAAYGKRVVPHDELAWVVEAATGHSLQLPSMGRFLGDLVERTYPWHMDVLLALVPPRAAESPVEERDEARPVPVRSSLGDESETAGALIDLTRTVSQQQTIASQPS